MYWNLIRYLLDGLEQTLKKLITLGIIHQSLCHFR